MVLPSLSAAPEESLYRSVCRTVIVIMVYVIAVPTWIASWSCVIFGASEASRGESPVGFYTFAAICWLVGTVVLIGGLSASVCLRNQRTFDTNLSDREYAVRKYGVPGYLTFPVQALIWSFVFAVAYFAARPVHSIVEQFGVWAEVTFFLAALLTVVFGIAFFDVWVGKAFRRWMRRFYPDEILLLANESGVVAADWGPIAWTDIKDIRYQIIRIAKASIPIIAIDLIKPPSPDEARAKWAHHLYYGEALPIRLKNAIEPASEIMNRLKGMAAASGRAPPQNEA